MSFIVNEDMRYIIITYLCVLFSLEISFAQKIDHLTSFRDIKSKNYFRYNYDNDFFSSSDKDYTQGYNFELVAPFFDKNPINRLFFRPINSETRYGISLEHIGFTPDAYEFPEIQFNDRPFAAAIMLKSFMIATNTEEKQRFTSALSLGLIGPGAFGKEMQVEIHKLTGNKIPLGWRNQIKNDVVINYQVSFEKQLIQFKNVFSIQVNTKANLGTLFTNASLGFNSAIGLINSPFTQATNRNKFKLYAYVNPNVNFIAYDATLQGGVFNKKSVYTIAAKNIERFTAQFNYGLILKTKTLYFEYTRTAITREFSYGNPSKWGGFKIGFTL